MFIATGKIMKTNKQKKEDKGCHWNVCIFAAQNQFTVDKITKHYQNFLSSGVEILFFYL